MAAKNTTAEIHETLERINNNLGNLADLITGQRSLFENLANQVEANHTNLQRQIDTLNKRINTLYDLIGDATKLSRDAFDLSKEANEMSREFAGNISLSRDLANINREMLSLAQQQLADMRLELTSLKNGR